MALQHATSGQVVALRPANEDVSQFSSIAIAKTEELELIRLVLPAGKSMPEHSVRGQVTLVCLSGAIAVEAHGHTALLRDGDMLYLEGGAVHSLRAEHDSIALLTIVLKD